MIAHIPRPLGPSQRIRVEKRPGFSGPARQTEQKVSPGVRPNGGTVLQSRDKTIELERATGLLERAALWLEVVELSVVPFDAASQGVPSLDPRQVGATDELLVAEQKRVGGLGVAKGCAAATDGATRIRRRLTSREHEARIPVIQACGSYRSRVVGSRDF